MSESEVWPDELIEWVYGPPGEPDDPPPSTGEIYKIQEEEDRIRWIPGYKEAVLRLIELTKAWHESWTPGESYPPQPPEHKQQALKVREMARQRGVPPWEKVREETLPW